MGPGLHPQSLSPLVPQCLLQAFLPFAIPSRQFIIAVMAKQQTIEEHEEQQVLDRASPGGKIVYKSVMHEAEEELGRSSAALFTAVMPMAFPSAAGVCW